MLLAVAATQMELEPFIEVCQKTGVHCQRLVAGVGVLETAVRLGSFLAGQRSQISGVVQFGVGGAYIVPEHLEKVELMAVCLADREVMGDLGICFPDRIEYFPGDLAGPIEFPLASELLSRAGKILHRSGVSYHSGTFVTVNSVSGTSRRGEMLRQRWQGLCENMEGGAVARLCHEYALPLVEIRVISNMVEDRNIQNWQLRQACGRAGEIAARLVKELT